jgi:lysyl-tRNA synthetase class 2
MIKLPEGSHNKCFLLTMDNGIQVVARIPNPFLPQKVETASEVATLDFLRNELNIPVPKVYAWSNSKGEDVGVEYIVMEKAPEEELAKCWSTVDISDKVDIVSQLASIQAKISSVDWKYYGSIYYRDEIDGCRDIPEVCG